jgi:very-short-patch-repair endonuclease
MINVAARSGRITRLAHGVYVATSAVPEDPIGQHLQKTRAIQLIRPRAVASHHTAALAWDLDLVDAKTQAAHPPAFILPASTSARSGPQPDSVVAVRALPMVHRVEQPSGLLVTSLTRTAVDVAASVGLPEALVTLDSAARVILRDRVGARWIRDRFSDERLLDSVRREFIGAMGPAATRLCRASLDSVVPLVDPRRESALESISYGEMVVAGLPLPKFQVRLVTPDGDIYPDFLWPEQRVIGEADGLAKYATREDLVREKLRQERLEALGFIVIRWTWEEIRRRPASVLARIAAALDMRGA